jgi:hypothetical protein
VALLPLLLVSAGCAAASRPDAEATVTRFYAAYHRHDGVGACRLLGPKVRDDVARSAHSSCARALLQERLPGAAPVRSAQVFGDQAQVRLRGDTAFVARLRGAWKVLAVGCTPQPQGPYQCLVESG